MGLIPWDLEDKDCDCAKLRRAKHELEARVAALEAQVGMLLGIIDDIREGRA